MAHRHILTTYQKARLQVVGYRAIQARVSEILAGYGINTSQWIILGWLLDNPQGLRITALAEVLDVEVPLITALTQPLEELELISFRVDPEDRRAKLVSLTQTAVRLVPKLEAELAEHLGMFDRAVSRGDMEQYFAALQQFIYVSRDPKD
jgi:DNA-binding MarR family transcriptional regulator